ncbi:uncharacterized protein LODBEIA_P54580 [Lodderomyces beijingensis]|uniref:Exocyst complex component SEC5 n=1 Tax=Lodderomyces beijingensis TaxID=1775926 RepID=A0ABP0ZSX5_9ASCO
MADLDGYVNLHFTSLDDLETIDAKVEELSARQNRIKEVTSDKLKPRSYVSDSTESQQESLRPQVDVEKLQDAVSKVKCVLSTVIGGSDDNSVRESCDNVEALIQEFGPLPLFVNLHGQLQTKLEAQGAVSYLERYGDVEGKLQADLSLSELEQVAREVDSLGDVTLISKLESKIGDEKHKLVSQQKKLQRESKWLNDSSISRSELTSLSKVFDQLIKLQAIKNTPSYPARWWAVDLLLEPFKFKFDYHFTSPNKETNKLSKPEWALDYVETFLEENLSLLSNIVDDTFKSLHRIGTYEIITSLLHLVRQKITKMIHAINAKIDDDGGDDAATDRKTLEKFGRLLSHLIFETSTFDQKLRNKYKYNPFITNFNDPVTLKWTGLTGDVLLDDPHTVDVWLNFENALATKRFKAEILGADDAFKIDFDYQAREYYKGEFKGHHHHQLEGYLRPTYSAYGVSKLINNLNSHFQTLAIVKFQLQYVSKIQLNLLDSYLDAIQRQFEIYIDKYNSKSVMNMIPGAMNEDAVAKEALEHEKQLLANIEKLTEIFCSTKFLINCMEVWGEELIFVQLWNMYRTLQADPDHVDDSEGIFGNLLQRYDKLLTKTVNTYVALFKTEIKQLLKKYVNSSQWEIPASQSTDMTPSSELNPLVNALPTYLQVISRSLSQLEYFAISDAVVGIVCDLLYEFILTNNHFSKKGVDQLIVDFGYVITSLQYALSLNSRRTSVVSGDTRPLSSDDNEMYVKVAQAIDLLDSMEVERAKKLSKTSDSDSGEMKALRSEYGHHLSQFSNADIKDLLGRIVSK